LKINCVKEKRLMGAKKLTYVYQNRLMKTPQMVFALEHALSSVKMDGFCALDRSITTETCIRDARHKTSVSYAPKMLMVNAVLRNLTPMDAQKLVHRVLFSALQETDLLAARRSLNVTIGPPTAMMNIVQSPLIAQLSVHQIMLIAQEE
jgi:hypothetical protein